MVATRGRALQLGLMSVALAAGCTTPQGQRRGDLLRVEPVSGLPTCTVASPSGRLSEGLPGQVVLEVQMRRRCSREEDVVCVLEEVRRVPTTTAVIASVVSGVAVAAGTGGVYVLLDGLARQAGQTGGVRADLGALLVLPALGVGAGVLLSLSSARQTTAVGEDRERRVGSATWERAPAGGTLRLGALEVALSNGRAQVPLSMLASPMLEGASLQGVPIEWEQPSRRALAACRQAVLDGSEGAPADCKPYAQAARCRATGWSSAEQIEESLRPKCGLPQAPSASTP